MAQKKYKTVDEMAKHLRVSPSTVRVYADKGILGRWQPGGKGCAVRYYELEEIHTAREVRA
ncbi:MAG: helix-turn-helix domain-containing protein [Mogibacterium sp.]|nr:helix-turn-helix domain-containing protein [Mogibacterium sp.]